MIKDEIQITDYLRMLYNRRKVIFLIFLTVFFIVVAVTFWTTPVYKATAEVYIDPNSSSFANFQQINSQFESTPVYVISQVSILKSDGVARRVVTKLGLDKKAVLKKGFISLPFLPHANAAGAPTPLDALNNFKDRLSVDIVKNSNVVDVSYESEDPKTAALVANTVVDTFIEQNLAMKAEPAQEAISWLRNKLAEIKSSMSSTVNNLEDFKKERELVDSVGNGASIPLQALNELNANLLAAKVRTNNARVKYLRVAELSKEPDGLMSLPEVINNKLVQDLKNERALLFKQEAELSKVIGEKHPKLVKLKGQIDSIQDQINAEVDSVVSSIKNEYYDALKTEQNLRRELETQKRETINYQKRTAEYDLKKQDIQGEQEIYGAVMKKLQETNVMGNTNVSNIHLLQRALPPLTPDKPKKVRDLAIGFIIACFVGIGVGAVLEHMDNTLKSPEDIEEEIGIAVLGIVPRSKKLLEHKSGKEIVAIADKRSMIAEAFRNIKGNIMLRGDIDPQVIQVCSASVSEGKSTVALNLAGSLAAAGEKVILIDGDLRRPSLNKIFKVSNKVGLSDIVKGYLPEEFIVSTGIPDLSFLPSGPTVINSGEIFRSDEIKELINKLRERFDRIIIDSPPYLGPIDSFLMTPLVDGVVLVVLSGKTGQDMMRKTVKDLRAIKANILGCVLNDYSGENKRYFHYYEESFRKNGK